MKKWISFLIVFLLLTGVGLPARAETDFGQELTPYDYQHITVGNPTPLRGQFFTELWGNSTSDTDVRHLVSGYNLVLWDTEESWFRFDKSVVRSASVTEDPEGNRVYLLTLWDDLAYSDGTPITACDYAFSVLLQGSPLIPELGGYPAKYDYLLGFDAYASGEKASIAGLRVPAEDQIQFTVRQESLPYFFELSRLGFYPYPIHVLAPGFGVFDSEEGAYIGKTDSEGKEGLTAELLKETILDAKNGYMVHPNPGSGPYCILSYDGKTAEFEINPYYKGNEDGIKPKIERLTYACADNAGMIRDLKDGKFALLNKVASGSTIAEGLKLCAEGGQYTRSNYPRIGLTYILFNPRSAAVQEQSVRQAIAYCMDAPEFIREYAGAFGMETYGLYGIGQWMCQVLSGTMEYPVVLSEKPTKAEEARYEEEIEAWEELTLDGLSHYDLDPEEAVRLLEDAGWTLNREGNEFDPEKDTVRCRQTDSGLVSLELTLGYPENADLEPALGGHLVQNLKEAGIGLKLVPVGFEQIVDAHIRQEFGSFDLMYLGDNFNISFDPTLFFWTDGNEGEESGADSLKAAYEELSALSEDMDRTEPRDLLGYTTKWLHFQERLSELLPVIPVYSNIYFDFYTRELHDYRIEEYVSWGDAITPSRMYGLSTTDAGDLAEVQTELEYAEGTGELDLLSLSSRAEHGKPDGSYGDLARFPEEVRRQVPDGFRTIHELTTVRISAEADKIESMTVKLALQTLYRHNEKVYLLIGIPEQGGAQWIVLEGTGMRDGSIETTLDHEQLERINEIACALAVVSAK